MQATALTRAATRTVSHAQDLTARGHAMWRVYKAIPDMVNGDATAFQFIFVSAGLATQFRWVPDAALVNMPAITSEGTLEARIVAEATYHVRALDTAGMAEPKAVACAMTLSAARMAGRRAWGLCDGDMVTAQIMAVPTGGEVQNDGTIAADVAGLGTVTEWNAAKVLCETFMAAHRDDYLAKVQHAAIGMPACNGVTVVRTTTHHFVDPHKAICTNVVDQVFSVGYVPPAVMTVDDFKDWLCHKSFHVVDSPRLVWMARSDDVKNRLITCGLGSAAVRIPAEFDPERAASSYKALAQRAQGAAAQSNVVVNTAHAIKLVADVSAAIAAAPNQTGMRASAELVTTFRDAHGYGLGFCAGFMEGLFDYISARKRARSVLEGYAVKKLEADYGEAWAEGKEHYMNAQKWRKTRARDGILAGHGIMGAAVPAAFSASETAAEAGN